MNTEITGVLLFFLSFFSLDSICEITEVLLCDPAEEGSDHVVEFKINTTYDSTPPLSILTSDGLLSQWANNWTTSQPEKYNISIRTEDNNWKVISILIYNISFKAQVENKVWFTVESAKCTIQEYVRATNISCRYNEVENGVNVSCWSTQLYSLPNCFFESNNHTDVSVATRNSSDDGFYKRYYTLNCTVFLPKSSVHCNVNVTVYPNVTGNFSDIQRYGTKKFNILNTDVTPPSLTLRNCPLEVKDGSTVTCECVSSDSKASNISIRWYIFNEIVSENGSLRFTANKTLQENFHCRSTKDFGCSSADVYYKPNFFNPAVFGAIRYTSKMSKNKEEVEINNLDVYNGAIIKDLKRNKDNDKSIYWNLCNKTN